MDVQVLGRPANVHARHNRVANRSDPHHLVIQDAERYGSDGSGGYDNDQTRYKCSSALHGKVAPGKIVTTDTGDARYERYVA